MANRDGIPFVIKFVSLMTVASAKKSVIQITPFFLTASSEGDVREQARSMISSLSESYRNSEGEVVTVECKGIHSVEELDYVDVNGFVELGGVLFSDETSVNDLLEELAVRQDIPLLD